MKRFCKVSFSAALAYFHSCRLYVRAHRRIALCQLEGYFLYLREVAEQSVRDSPAYMFQQLGRNVHFCFHGLMHICIAHGVGYVVRLCRTPDVDLQAQADGNSLPTKVSCRATP